MTVGKTLFGNLLNPTKIDYLIFTWKSPTGFLSSLEFLLDCDAYK